VRKARASFDLDLNRPFLQAGSLDYGFSYSFCVRDVTPHGCVPISSRQLLAYPKVFGVLLPDVSYLDLFWPSPSICFIASPDALRLDTCNFLLAPCMTAEVFMSPTISLCIPSCGEFETPSPLMGVPLYWRSFPRSLFYFGLEYCMILGLFLLTGTLKHFREKMPVDSLTPNFLGRISGRLLVFFHRCRSSTFSRRLTF